MSTVARSVRYVGLDVHAETITVAVAQGRQAPQSLGTIANRPEALRQLIKKMGRKEDLRVCYEAGPTGYALYWQLMELGVECQVIAPSKIPRASGDHVKTDRRDAEKLAKAYRSGDLTPVWVPNRWHEALRDLVRARAAAKQDETRAKHRLTKYLMRYGLRAPNGARAWTRPWWAWVGNLKLEHSAQNATLQDYMIEIESQRGRIQRLDGALDKELESAPKELTALVEALQVLRGIAKISAVTLATEFGSFERFPTAKHAMSYDGIVSSERSSGSRSRRGGITKTGNAHVRRILVESAHHYRHRPRLNPRQMELQGTQSAKVNAIGWKAQQRLTRRYRALANKDKPKGKVVTAVARELVGFIWAIGVEIESQFSIVPRKKVA